MGDEKQQTYKHGDTSELSRVIGGELTCWASAMPDMVWFPLGASGPLRLVDAPEARVDAHVGVGHHQQMRRLLQSLGERTFVQISWRSSSRPWDPGVPPRRVGGWWLVSWLVPEGFIG